MNVIERMAALLRWCMVCEHSGGRDCGRLRLWRLYLRGQRETHGSTSEAPGGL